MKRSLDRLLRPTTIAVFGGKEAGRVVEQCEKMGFAGEIWPVHPTKDAIGGRPCFRSVADLPSPPDAAFIGVNRSRTIDIVRDLSACGAGGAVCYASGFSEAAAELADGHDLQKTLVEAAGDIPIIGPNCYGLINALDGALLWPDQHGLKSCRRGVAILTQSSNIAINLSMQQRGLPVAYLMTAGNQAQTGISELALAVMEDERVTAIGLHVEGFDDIRLLEKLAFRARELKKPVVMLKVGKSEAATRATVSHTASIAGNHAISAAILARLGIARVDTLPELIETLKLLHVHGPLQSRDISSMSCSGGEASLMADAAVSRKVNFRDLSDTQKPLLRQTLGDMVTLANPLDYHTFVWGDLDRQTSAFSAMMAGDYALNIVVLDFPRSDRCNADDWTTTLEAVKRASARTGGKAALLASFSENLPEDVAENLVLAGVVPLSGIDDGLTAAEAAASIGEAWRLPQPPPLLSAPPAGGEPILLDEFVAKRELASFGLTIPTGRVAGTPQDAAREAAEIGFPVVLKGLGIAHKSEANAVILNLADTIAVESAAIAMDGAVTGFMVEAMISGTVAEVIVGAVRDPVVGLVMTIGAGGILAELFDDAAILTLPASEEAIAAAIAGLRVSKPLTGYRGRPSGDVPSLVRAIAQVAEYVAVNATWLEELDINPIMVLPHGSGTVVADALIRRRRHP